MVNFIFIQMALLLQAIVAVRGENPTNTKCEDGWSDETSVGLGCILADKRAVFNFAQANDFCKAQDSRLIELVTELQMKHVSNLLKNVSRSKNTDQWWGRLPPTVPTTRIRIRGAATPNSCCHQQQS